MKYRYSYLVGIQFLGFRFSGWQKQTNAKTIHDLLDKTLSFVLEKETYKTIGSSRTDAKVSANRYYFQLFSTTIIEEKTFLAAINSNFSGDLKALSFQKVPLSFNVINAPKIKEYHYYFSFGEKAHPFCAPLLVSVLETLDIALMQKAAKLFEGTHFFNKYCTKPTEHTILQRKLETSEIVKNTFLTASFFPKNTFVFRVRGQGFLRYQIRLMMATLFEVGKGNISLEEVTLSLQEDNDKKALKSIAPASGLQLYHVDFLESIS